MAKAAPDPLVKRRNEGNDDSNIATKKRKTLEESTTNLVHLPYDEQLKVKQKDMADILKNLGNQVIREIPTMRSFVKKQQNQFNELPCELLEIKPSPVIEGYRNKCEFTIGKNLSGEKVVGFRLGTYSSGSVEVESAINLRNIPESMKNVIKSFEIFVRNSKLEVFDNEHQTGHFRQLSVRTSNATKEVMAIIGVHPQNLSEEEIDELKKEVVAFITENEGKSLGITSLFYLPMPKKLSGERHTEQHLFGTKYITETIHNLKFRISPSAFFQVNTACAEVLYQTAIDFASPTDKTTILDICCGTGTIGLCFAKHVKSVIGVESIPEAICDAKVNASENNISNCQFIDGLAENSITGMMVQANHDSENIIAIVDPPRAGLHHTAIQALRSAKNLNRLVYVSCSPAGATRNFKDLMRPMSKTMKGKTIFFLFYNSKVSTIFVLLIR